MTNKTLIKGKKQDYEVTWIQPTSCMRIHIYTVEERKVLWFKWQSRTHVWESYGPEMVSGYAFKRYTPAELTAWLQFAVDEYEKHCDDWADINIG